MAVFRHPTWARFKAEHPPGSQMTLAVRTAVPWGLYLDLGEGMLWRALLPSDQMAPIGRPKSFPADFPRVGDEITVFVKSYADDARTIRLTQDTGDHGPADAR